MKKIAAMVAVLMLALAATASAERERISYEYDGSNQDIFKVTDSALYLYNSSGTTVWTVTTSGNVTLTGDITISGDVSAAGGYKMALVFAHEDVGTSLDSHAPVAGTTASTADSDLLRFALAPWAGSITGVSLVASTAVTAGSAHVEVTSGTCGSPMTYSGFTVALHNAGGQTTYNSNTQAKDTDAFSAGECVGVDMNTSSSFAPVTADLMAIVYVEQ